MYRILLREVKEIDQNGTIEMLGFFEGLYLDSIPEVGDFVKGEESSRLYKVMYRVHSGVNWDSDKKPYTKLLVVDTRIDHGDTD